MTGLPDQLARVLALLETTQPDPAEYDVVWHGPYYIRRRREWCRSQFMLYRGTLYVSLFVERSWHAISWKLGTDRVDPGEGLPRSYLVDEGTWQEALAQIEHRLRSAIKNFSAYNRRVARMLPPGARTGTVQRGLTWPTDGEPPLTQTEARELARSVARGSGQPSIEEMTVSAYLRVAAVAYDAVFDELHGLSPLDKYRRRADGRHGGMLDLDPDDPEAFADWFHGGTWAGTHPWEIVFGHPHGILLRPSYDTEEQRWRYSLSVDSLGWYAEAARMAIALAEHEVRFELYRWQQVSDALLGLDDVSIGGDVFSLTYEELCETRPASVEHIRWDPIPQMGPITPEQQERVSRAQQAD